MFCRDIYSYIVDLYISSISYASQYLLKTKEAITLFLTFLKVADSAGVACVCAPRVAAVPSRRALPLPASPPPPH